MRDPIVRKVSFFAAALATLLLLPAAHLLFGQAHFNDPVQLTKRYLEAVYARDYGAVYPWISAEDHKRKSESEYLRENPSFSGVAPELSRTLAQMIELHNVHSDIQGDRAIMRFTLRVPDANDPSLQQLLLDFDPDRLARLSAEEKRTIEEKLESMREQSTLPMIEGEDSLQLLREQGRWKVFNDWGKAIQVKFKAEIKEGLAWEFTPLQETVLAKPGETLQAFYEAKNLSGRPLTGKARHFDQPKEAEKYLQIIQCFCFIQYTLAPGETKQFPLVFRVDENVPKDMKEFYVDYQFYPIDKFPKNDQTS